MARLTYLLIVLGLLLAIAGAVLVLTKPGGVAEGPGTGVHNYDAPELYPYIVSNPPGKNATDPMYTLTGSSGSASAGTGQIHRR